MRVIKRGIQWQQLEARERLAIVCRNGHPRTAENTAVYRYGTRCRECHRRSARRFYRRNRERIAAAKLAKWRARKAAA